MKKTIAIETYGANHNKGNIVGIQPYVKPLDYSSAESFYAALDRYMDEARQAGIISDKAIVVFPEYIGAWFVVTGLPKSVYRLTKISQLSTRIMLHYQLAFLKARLQSKNIKQAVFLSRSQEMAKIYDHTFSQLALKYHTTIVAGSIVLPNPNIEHGRLVVGSGPLNNVSAIYKPDGMAYDKLIKKINLVSEEKDFTAPGSVDELTVYDTPSGKLAVLICADSWHKENYQKIELLGAEIVVVPSYLSPNGVWDKPWHGDKSITEKEAWLKHALAGQIKNTKIKYGMNVFLRGDLWDLGSDGQTIAINNGEAMINKNQVNAITNLWME